MTIDPRNPYDKLSDENKAMVDACLPRFKELVDLCMNDASLFAQMAKIKDRSDGEIWATVAFIHGSLKATADHVDAKEGTRGHINNGVWDLFSKVGYDLATMSYARKETKQ